MIQSTSPQPATTNLLKLICRALDDKKAEDVRVLDVHKQSSITDYLVLATGTSDPHLRALRVELEKVIDAAKAQILGMDTDQGSGWLVIDAFDIMVHVFTPTTRKLYRLETLWKDATEITVADLLSDKVAPAKHKAVPAKKPAAKKNSLVSVVLVHSVVIAPVSVHVELIQVVPELSGLFEERHLNI